MLNVLFKILQDVFGFAVMTQTHAVSNQPQACEVLTPLFWPGYVS